MRIIDEIPIRSGGPAHSVREDDYGNLFCTCKAADFEKVCWAVKKVESRRFIERFQAAKAKLNGIVIPDKQQLIKEQWEYIMSQKEKAARGIHP